MKQVNIKHVNILLCVLIFGSLIAMFAGIYGYRYFSKPASIQAFLKTDAGSVYTQMGDDVSVKAKKNYLKIAISTDDKEIKKYYKSKDGKKELKDMAAYYITAIKPQTRALTATIKMSVNDETSVKMTYREAKKHLKKEQEE